MTYYKEIALTNEQHLSFIARFCLIVTSFMLLQSGIPIKNSSGLSLSISFPIKNIEYVSQNLSAFECKSDFVICQTVSSDLLLQDTTEEKQVICLTPKAEKKQNTNLKKIPSFFALTPYISGIKQKPSLLASLPNQSKDKFSVYKPVYFVSQILTEEASNYGITTPVIDELENAFETNAKKIVKATSVKIASSKAKAVSTFSWPVRGKITSPFGMRIHPVTKSKAFHNGIDIRASSGTNIQAPVDGEIIFTGWAGGYGKMARLKTSNGMVLVFAHMTKIVCKEGTKIKKGQLIGTVGSTGRSTGPHLHFGVMNTQKDYINPLTYLP